MLSLLKATWVLSQLLYNHSEPRTLCANPSSTSPQMVRIPSLHIPSHIPQISFMFQVPKSQQHTVRLTELTVSLNGVEVDLGKCLQMHISPLNNINNVKKKILAQRSEKGKNIIVSTITQTQGRICGFIALCREDWKWMVYIQSYDAEKKEQSDAHTVDKNENNW